MLPGLLSPYSLQKYTNEQYAGLFHRLYGLHAVCLRYFNVFGPRQDPSSPYSGVVSIFMTCARQGKSPVIYGNGRQTRDFIYVEDVVRANLLAAQQEGLAELVFNIGTSQSIEINTLWDKIVKLAGCSVLPQYVAPRPGDIVHSLAGIQKAKDFLGFTPQTDFERGLQKTFAWYKKHS
jgi:UDP-glucose 4-epimerase